MSIRMLPVTNTAVAFNRTPFAPGFDAIVHNSSAGALTIQGSDDNVTYDAGTAVPIGGYINLTLRPWHRLTTAGTVYVIGSI